MKAWFVCDREDIGVLFHAETRGKAKVLGAAEMSFDPLDYIYVYARRVPELDDKPLTIENVEKAQVFDPSPDGQWYRYNPCRCEICKCPSAEGGEE